MNHQKDRAWGMMQTLRMCMLVTQASGILQSRPMSSIVKTDEGRVYFLTEASSSKDIEIEQNPSVLLAFGDGRATFVSVRANARIDHDRELVKRLWSTGAQAFWPQGPEDPNIVVITATPHQAEYWEGDMLAPVKIVLAALTGTRVSAGDNANVSM
jgi:general stress protein 26